MSYRHNVRLDSNSWCSSKLFFLYSSDDTASFTVKRRGLANCRTFATE